MLLDVTRHLGLREDFPHSISRKGLDITITTKKNPHRQYCANSPDNTITFFQSHWWVIALLGTALRFEQSHCASDTRCASDERQSLLQRWTIRRLESFSLFWEKTLTLLESHLCERIEFFSKGLSQTLNFIHYKKQQQSCFFS